MILEPTEAMSVKIFWHVLEIKKFIVSFVAQFTVWYQNAIFLKQILESKIHQCNESTGNLEVST